MSERTEVSFDAALMMALRADSYEENFSSFVFDRYGRCECSGCSYRLWCFLLHGKLCGVLCGSIQRSRSLFGSCTGICDHQGVQRCKGVSGRGSAL